MYNPEAARALIQKKCAWFRTPLGSNLGDIERDSLQKLVQDLYGPVVMQIGCNDEAYNLNLPDTSEQILVDLDPTCGFSGEVVTAEPEALPFATQSVNVVILPHALEYALDPHELLREASRILISEGHLILIGFNPMSLWGLWRLLLKWRNEMPWCGQFFSLKRVQDWLTLLGFEIVSGTTIYYRPPIQHRAVTERLVFMELMGQRWWPIFSGIYILVARKREKGVRPIGLRQKWRIVPGIARPIAKSISKTR